MKKMVSHCDSFGANRGDKSTLVGSSKKLKSNEDNYQNISLHDFLERKIRSKGEFYNLYLSTTCPACKRLRPVLNSTYKRKRSRSFST